ncbi:unnamed protein product, partial [marine sediment metagenome]
QRGSVAKHLSTAYSLWRGDQCETVVVLLVSPVSDQIDNFGTSSL